MAVPNQVLRGNLLRGMSDGLELLSVTDLVVTNTRNNVDLVRGIELMVPYKGRVGLVGESGSGKSMTANTILRLLPPLLRVTRGAIHFEGRDLLRLPEHEMETIRGRHISIVYQNTIASLNPLLSVGDQIATVCRVHTGVSRREAHRRAIGMLEALGIPDAEHRARDYPHQFSGGMAQRVAIAMALICGPKLLIADEPTTGLDATIQSQVLDVIDQRVRDSGAALLLISHDLEVIQIMCDIIAVAYAGLVLEFGRTADVMERALNPYTRGLVACLQPNTISYIPGRIPEPGEVATQCPFHARCPLATERCKVERPLLRELEPNHWVACHNV
jgi:oligopeptide/dipeptide ABC transporter ATP-binding protein